MTRPHREATPEAIDFGRRLRQPGSGPGAARIIQAITAGIARLADYPSLGWASRVGGHMEYVVRAYRVPYRANDDEVAVLAIFGPGQEGVERV